MYGKNTVTLKPGAPRPYYSYWGEYEEEAEKAFTQYLKDGLYGTYCATIFELRVKHNVIGADD